LRFVFLENSITKSLKNLTPKQKAALQTLSQTKSWWKKCTSISVLRGQLEILDDAEWNQVDDRIVPQYLFVDLDFNDLKRALKKEKHELLDGLVSKHCMDRACVGQQ
jgi:hypothetical protein